MAKPSLTLAKLDEGNYECLGSREAVKVDEKCEIKRSSCNVVVNTRRGVGGSVCTLGNRNAVERAS